MSNDFSAGFGATPSASANAAPVRTGKDATASFWRRMFDAWVQSYANRIDPDGKVMCEL